MLSFFQKYQRFFFIFVTVMVIASFAFFGTFDTYSRGETTKADRMIGKTIDGSPMMLSEVRQLSRFLSSDWADVNPNFCNDGVIRNDLLKTGVADLLAATYFPALKQDLAQRLEKAKRYRPYMHPEVPALSARAVWERFMPSMLQDLDALQAEEGVTSSTFSYLARLYQQQSLCPPEFVRRVLFYSRQQFPWAKPDAHLQYDDLSLFGFHSIGDWFGKDFVDLSAEFILNAARIAEQKGYRVSLEEAKADLLTNFQASMEKFAAAKQRPNCTLKQHLHVLGMDERAAAESLRAVLLFRRYFHGIGKATFIDRMPYRDFASFALETFALQKYQWPEALRLTSGKDFIAFQVYLQAIANHKDTLSLPRTLLSMETIEKQTPELVRATYRMQWAECSREEIGLLASVKEVRDWQLTNWKTLRKEFPFLAEGSSREECFEMLEKLDAQNRVRVDAYARLQLVEEHPEWMAKQLSSSPSLEKIMGLDPQGPLGSLVDKASSGDELAQILLARYSEDRQTFYRIEKVEKIADKHILTFAEAQKEGVMELIVDRYLEAAYKKLRVKTPEKFQVREGEWKLFSSVKEDVARMEFAKIMQAMGQDTLENAALHRLEFAAKEALACLQKNPNDPKWLSQKIDLLTDQFKLETTEAEVQRNAREDWMKEQVLLMMPGDWSSVYVPSDGDITFFYFKEKKGHEDPILQQITQAQEIISADAERYIAERLLEIAVQKRAMVIPLQPEDL